MAWRKRIEGLRASLEASPLAAAARTDLPPEVIAFAERAGASPSSARRVVKLDQRGEMRQRPRGVPLAFTANQVLVVGDMGFLWHARFSVMGVPAIQVIEYLVADEGGLEGRLCGALPMFRVGGTDETFRGEAMRYLGELMWNPDAILFNAQLQWRVLDRMVLSVAVGDGLRRSEVRLLLDEAGDAVRVEAHDRPRLEGNTFSRCEWFGRGWDCRRMGGRRIPSRAEAGWKVGGEEFVYWRGSIESWRTED